MFAAQRRYRGKKIVVTLRKAFGFDSSVMGMNPWGHQAISLDLSLYGCVRGRRPAVSGAKGKLGHSHENPAHRNAAAQYDLSGSFPGIQVRTEVLRH